MSISASLCLGQSGLVFGILRWRDRLRHQVVETTRHDGLHGIWAVFCFRDMCAADQPPPKRPKIDKTEPARRPCVVIHVYNFAKSPFDGRNGESVICSF